MAQSERESLEAHVDICALRYENLSEQYSALSKRLDKLENKFDDLLEVVQSNQASMTKILVTTAGTVIAGVLTTVVVLLMK